MYSALIQAKVQQIQAQVGERRTQQEVVDTIRAASVICTQRSYSDFIFNCKRTLPDFFGFEAIGILFRDQTDDFLFCIEEDNKEGEQDQIERKRQKQSIGQALT